MTCLSCSKTFTISKTQVAKGHGKYCSLKCRVEHKAATAWDGFDKDEFVKLYQDHTAKELAIKYGVYEGTVVKWATELGIRKCGVLFERLDKERFRKDYADLTLPEVAKKYNIHQGTVNGWARRLSVSRKKGQWRDTDYQFTEKQISVIVGSMLGDGTLDKCESRGEGVRGRTFNSRYGEVHGIEQRDWLAWKKEQLEPLPMQLKDGETVARKNLGKGLIVADNTRKYKNCTLRTIKHPLFTEMEESWYKRDEKGEYVYKRVGRQLRRIKIVPTDLRLTKLALAVWYMDDGNRNKKRCSIFTLDFTESEVDYLVEQVKGLGIAACWKNRYSHTERFYITIGEESYLDFINLVREQLPDLPESMAYKVDLSDYRAAWWKTPDYHPQSKLNDELVAKIMDDARQKTPQRQIAKKYDLCYKQVNALLKGHRLYKSEFADAVNYRSTTGVEGVSYNEERERYISQIMLHHPDGRPLNLCLGYYKDKETATLVANESRRLREEGVTDPDSYRQMRLKFKSPTRSTNKSGMTGVSYDKTHNKWMAMIGFDGTRIELGAYKEKEQACHIRQAADMLFKNGVKDRQQYLSLKDAYKASLKIGAA